MSSSKIPLTSTSGIYITTWCSDDVMTCFGRKSLHMHLVNWVGIVALSRDAEVDTLITPFMKGEMVAPGAYCDTLPQVPWCALTSSQPGYIFIKTCRKNIICTGMYKVSKTWVCTKLKHLRVSNYTNSLGFRAKFTLISQWGEWCFRKISLVEYMT